MNILFIHQNFPGQFKHLAPVLASKGNKVVAMTLKRIPKTIWKGVHIRPYQVDRGTSSSMHPWLTDFESKVIRGDGCLKTFISLKEEGFSPDLIIAHHGWGESLFVKDVWPSAKLGIYCEFFYHPFGADFDFDPEFYTKEITDISKLRLKNINNYMHFEIANLGICPTLWQASTFPDYFRSKISIIHDGIDTTCVKPNPDAKLLVNKSLTLSSDDEVITFVNRNLEPCRGFHIFMRAIPKILAKRPQAQILIIGGDNISYGAKPDGFRTWKEQFLAEIRPLLSSTQLSKIHFLGLIEYPHFISVLQISTVHVYLTYPFVLSWSLLEAMSAGCAVVASNTQPLHEVIQYNHTGIFVDFFDETVLSDNIIDLLEDPLLRKELGREARLFVQKNYDLHSICLPKQLNWLEKLSSS